MTIQPILKKIYPEGSTGGECGTFAEKLITIPNVGNTLISKTQDVKNNGIPIGLLNQAFRLGDVLILNVGTLDGHVAVINTIDFIQGLLTLTESNYHLDQRVHHTRQISITDPGIVGILRGAPKFTFPAVAYPLKPKVAIIMNNQPMWQSLLKSMGQIQDWFFKNSAGKIQLEITNPIFEASLQNIPTVASGGGMGLITQIIDENYYKKNIMPLAPGHDIYIFVIRPEDFKGQVYNANGILEVGYSYEPHYPIKTFIALDENTNYPPDYPDPDLQGFAKFAVHEIAHGLYGICLNDKLPSGSDLTHTHFYGLNNNPVNPPAIFNDFNLDLLNQKIN